jgi:hypothetical protein
MQEAIMFYDRPIAVYIYIYNVACRLKADYLSQRGRPLLSNVYN